MKQFLLPLNILPGESLELGGVDFHYLSHVRRMKVGDSLSCRTPDGRIQHCQAISITTTSVVIQAQLVQEVSPMESEGLRLTLAQGIPKGKKLDLVIRQSVELGVASILPLQCRNSVPDLTERWDRKKVRFEGIIREAYQQSGGSCLARLQDPCSVQEMVINHPLCENELGLFMHEEELEQSSLHGYLGRIPSAVRLVVGPEGGLSAIEVSQLQQAGYKPLFLGRQVLRSETAAIVGLGALGIMVRESPFWILKNRNNA